MRKQGCEIEAKSLTYTIHNCNPSQHLFKKIWSSEETVDSEIPTPQPPVVRHVLNNVTCRAKPWEILAVVGPSGAGKSTLLELLAGRLPLPPPPATILVDDLPLSKRSFRRISAFVPQKDCLFPLLTVRETLAFTARLRLGLPTTAIHTRVETLLAELGLAHVASLRVSSISGGERRRVSIAVEAVHDPAVLILDEPTSGLDSSSALQIVDMLRSMAESGGRTIILSIHQPCWRIVKLFGSLLLLSDGSVLHHGTIADLISRLAAAGHPLPAHTNPVEFAIDSLDSLSHLQRNEKANHHSTLQQLFHIHKVADNHSTELFNIEFDYANNPFVETSILTLRFMKNVFRTKELFTCRTFQMLLSGLVLGSIFFDLKFDIAGARDRVGLFAFILTFLLSCTTEALPIFLKERDILMKETSGGAYRVSSYVIANGLVFLPFLFILALLFASPVYWLAGLDRNPSSFAFFLLLIWLILYTANSVVVCFSSLAPNFIVGNSVIAGVMGSFFLFSGYFIRKEGIPGCWVFMNYLSLFRYPFEAFLVNEFSGEGKCLEEKFGVCLLDGDTVLRKEGLGEVSRWKDVIVMVGFILGYRFGSYMILRIRSKCAKKGGLQGSFFDL
ncbi:ABC transporter G family member 5 [Dendrobium catenatum]|uniref:ABC transporter G family member 5 n=1 Tax=Dendrobium catenatum TaxID=906689 RepID=A0A2I0WJK7_9ASPA|nr:ABC transporter G family member 5 [Dendrobium catenatum]PKU75848.1 ABC transporter G family member 5 [Dendrobium catenatum]